MKNCSISHKNLKTAAPVFYMKLIHQLRQCDCEWFRPKVLILVYRFAFVSHHYSQLVYCTRIEYQDPQFDSCKLRPSANDDKCVADMQPFSSNSHKYTLHTHMHMYIHTCRQKCMLIRLPSLAGWHWLLLCINCSLTTLRRSQPQKRERHAY